MAIANFLLSSLIGFVIAVAAAVLGGGLLTCFATYCAGSIFIFAALLARDLLKPSGSDEQDIEHAKPSHYSAER